jgi:hypothetical protein
MTETPRKPDPEPEAPPPPQSPPKPRFDPQADADSESAIPIYPPARQDGS